MDIVIITIFYLIVLLFSVIMHELAHGYAAYDQGDPTAKYAGRLTMNPIKHLDWFGSIFLPLLLYISHSPIMFGWAKPVPINPYNFKDKKWGELKVSIAGPASNFSLAIVFGLILRFLPASLSSENIVTLLAIIIETNIWLAIFNLIPVPPLDGSWILFSVLPAKYEHVKLFLKQYGIILLFALIFFGGYIWQNLIDIIFFIITGH